ncbi:MAG: sensor histidine kinase [Ktedonobacterales bacterium]
MSRNSANLQRHAWDDEIAILNACRSELDRVSAELEELRLLLAQSTQEVETLNQRKVLAAAKIHEMEERLEHYSRQDIRDAYLESGGAEMRAFMLSEQRDQWQAKVRTHERYLSFLTRLLQTLPLIAAPLPSLDVSESRTLPPMPPPAASQVRPLTPPATPVRPWPPVVPSEPPEYSPYDLELPMTSSLPFAQQETEMLTIGPPGVNVQDGPVAMGPQHLVMPATGMLTPQMQQQSLLARVILAQETVRQRVAQRLHDGPAQALANIVLEAEVCAKLLATNPQRATGELEQLKHMVTVTLQETRKFIFELHPMTLADLGLAATLKRYGEEVSARYKIQVPVVVPQVEPFLPMGKRVAIFRVAQEAVANAIEHSQATLIRIRIDLPPGRLVLIVEDTGTGFDVEAAQRTIQGREGWGMLSMRERAEVLGGWLRVESAVERGTRVELSIPL